MARSRWLVLLVAVPVLVACTSEADDAGRGQQARRPSAASPATMSTTRPASDTVPRRGSLIVLTCQDSAGGVAAPPSVAMDGVASPALAGTHAQPAEVFTITGPNGRDYLMWKLFLNIAPSATPYRTVSIVSQSQRACTTPIPKPGVRRRMQNMRLIQRRASSRSRSFRVVHYGTPN